MILNSREQEHHLLVTSVVLQIRTNVLYLVVTRHDVVRQHLTTAERTRCQPLQEPRVQARLVKRVFTDQPPQILPFLEFRQTYGAVGRKPILRSDIKWIRSCSRLDSKPKNWAQNWKLKTKLPCVNRIWLRIGSWGSWPQWGRWT